MIELEPIKPIEFIKTLELVKYNDEILKNGTDQFDFANPQVDPQELFFNMRNTMCAKRGIGLAAPQVGFNLRMFTVGDPDMPSSVIAVFNPTIVATNIRPESEDVIYSEGCLTFPGLFLPIKRPRDIRVRYANEKGDIDTKMFDGLTARVFLHEYDHLQGIVFTSLASRYHLERARKDLKLHQRRVNAQSSAK